MHIVMASVITLITLTAPLSDTAFAQPHQMVEPAPLAPNEPRAKQASAIVELILKGDRAGLIKVLQADAAASFVKASEFEQVVDAQIARLANKGYAVIQLMTGRGADVFVELESAKAEPTNIVVRFTVDAPHRVEGFTQARMVTGSFDPPRVVEYHRQLDVAVAILREPDRCSITTIPASR